MIFFLEGLKNAAATHKPPKNVSVEVIQKQAGRERGQEQKAWEENHALNCPGLDGTMQTEEGTPDDKG